LEAVKHRVPDYLDVPWSLRDVFLFVVAWFGIQLVIGAGLALLAPHVPAVNHFIDLAQKGDIGVSFGLDLVDAALGLGIVALYLRKYRVGWAMVGWRRVSILKTGGYVLGVLLVFVLAASALIYVVSLLVPSFNANQPQNNEFLQTARAHPDLALVALVLLPPVLEETIFRGFLFPAIAKRTGLIWGAVLSSALFGIAHMQANISVYTFVLGLVLCFMYVRLRSILPGMALHMLNNYLALMAHPK
jgi:membrane protease YdiL (CAAX protease family)